MALIEVEHLRKSYTLGGQTVRALDDVSLSIEAGEFVAIMGQSGSGKSTLLRLVNRLVEPSAGRVLHGETDVTALAPESMPDGHIRVPRTVEAD